jgi:hypothetical protein
MWRILGKAITPESRSRSEDLLRVPAGGRNSWLERLRRGPVRFSGPAPVRAIARLQSMRDLGIKLPKTAVTYFSNTGTTVRLYVTSCVRPWLGFSA